MWSWSATQRVLTERNPSHFQKALITWHGVKTFILGFFFNGKHEEGILQIAKSVILDMVVFISFFQSDNLFGFSSQKIMVTTRYHSFLDM